MLIAFAGGVMDVLSLDQEVGAWDSVLLDPLTEDSFIANLHQRFKRDHIYVSCYSQNDW
jgi:myosin-1